MIFEILILVLVAIGFLILGYYFRDMSLKVNGISDKFNDELAKNKAIQDEVDGTIADNFKSNWKENNDPLDLGNFADNLDLSALEGFDMSSLLGGNIFKPIFSSILSEESKMLADITESLGVPKGVARPILITVMTVVAETFNKAISGKLLKRGSDKKENQSEAIPVAGNFPQFNT